MATQTILITGATGNVGQAILDNFHPHPSQRVFKASRRKNQLKADELYFDFEDPEAAAESLAQTDILFLLRPPQLADVSKYFRPLIEQAEKNAVRQVIFLSVQGADKVSFIPHAKIEKLLRESRLSWVFIRPSYFMQNLSTSLLQDIRNQDRIFLPAGKAGFLWVDVEDIGRAIAKILTEPEKHQNRAYTITGKEYFNFKQVADILSRELKREIRYISPNLIRFYLAKQKQGLKPGFILVMIMLHFLPRFQPAPEVSEDFNKLTGQEPHKLLDFIRRNKQVWL